MAHRKNDILSIVSMIKNHQPSFIITTVYQKNIKILSLTRIHTSIAHLVTTWHTSSSQQLGPATAPRVPSTCPDREILPSTQTWQDRSVDRRERTRAATPLGTELDPTCCICSNLHLQKGLIYTYTYVRV